MNKVWIKMEWRLWVCVFKVCHYLINLSAMWSLTHSLILYISFYPLLIKSISFFIIMLSNFKLLYVVKGLLAEANAAFLLKFSISEYI